MVDLILKAPDRECYAVMIDDILYIPVVSTVFEAGTDNPLLVAKRVVSTGLEGFWTKFSGTLDWYVVAFEDVSSHWQICILQLLNTESIGI